MDFIISKGRELPKDESGMESEHWFNMWEKKLFPYKELSEGDILYWLDTLEKRLAWRTIVTKVERRPYNDKTEIWEKYQDSMTEKYYDSKPNKGYFLYYKVNVLEKIDIPKPNYKFKRLGWEKLDEENFKRWFNSTAEDDITLDDNVQISNKNIIELLNELSKKMENVSPEGMEKVIWNTLRKDTKIVKMLKEAAGFKCQFPNCDQPILTRQGDLYIEVAHIKPVKEGGQSVLGNLIVLCPNHHKEFDLGVLNINEDRTLQLISGTLNGKVFKIALDYFN